MFSLAFSAASFWGSSLFWGFLLGSFYVREELVRPSTSSCCFIASMLFVIKLSMTSFWDNFECVF